MLTQREKIEILTDKIKHHDFFEGPFMISRREAQVILKAMDLQHKNLQRNYDRYQANKEKISQKSKERYQANKEEIKEKRKLRRKELEFIKAMEAVK